MLVLGLGDTGLSVARWVEREGGKVRVADTRAAPPRQKDFSGELHTGRFQPRRCSTASTWSASAPACRSREPVVRAAVAKGIPVVGDIELFAWQQHGSTVLAITGTNGKTTVTALTGHLLRSAGVDCEVAGNIAPPVLRRAAEADRRRPRRGCSSFPATSSRPPGRSRRTPRRC